MSSTNLFAGTWGGGVFLSIDNGTSWTAVNSGWTYTTVLSLAVSGTNLFAGTGGGVFLSINNGTSWTAVNSGLTNTTVLSLAVSGTNLFAGTEGGVFLSTNNGTSWTAVNSGLTNTVVLSLAVSGTNLFAGTYGGVWTRPLSEIITSVRLSSSEVPSELRLEQNYPNPFNPRTRIEFTVPEKGRAILKIYNVLGQEVATLFDQQAEAGHYLQTNFDAGGLAGGVYFSRLEFNGRQLVRKILMLR